MQDTSIPKSNEILQYFHKVVKIDYPDDLTDNMKEIEKLLKEQSNKVEENTIDDATIERGKYKEAKNKERKLKQEKKRVAKKAKTEEKT